MTQRLSVPDQRPGPHPVTPGVGGGRHPPSSTGPWKRHSPREVGPKVVAPKSGLRPLLPCDGGRFTLTAPGTAGRPGLTSRRVFLSCLGPREGRPVSVSVCTLHLQGRSRSPSLGSGYKQPHPWLSHQVQKSPKQCPRGPCLRRAGRAGVAEKRLLCTLLSLASSKCPGGTRVPSG